MSQSSFSRQVVLAAALALLPFTPALADDPGEPGVERKVRREVVVERSADGGDREIHRQVFVFGGAGEEGEPVRHEFHFALGRAFLGVQAVELTPELRRHFGAPEEAGVLVSRLVDDAPAVAAGLQVGDIVTEVDGESVRSNLGLAQRIARAEPGDSVVLSVYRDGRLETLTATLTERDRRQIDVAPMIWKSGDEGFEFEAFHCEEGDCDAIAKEIRSAIEHVQSPEWQAELERLTSERGELHERLQELENELREVAESLERLTPDEER